MKYELKDGKILRDGHTMFLEDVVTDLKRKVHLENIVDMVRKSIPCTCPRETRGYIGVNTLKCSICGKEFN